MLEGLPQGGAARVDGRLVPVPAAWRTRTVPFPDRSRFSVTIPWGDLSTAYRFTGIPNIETYMAMDAAHVSVLRWDRGRSCRWPGSRRPALLAAWVKKGAGRAHGRGEGPRTLPPLGARGGRRGTGGGRDGRALEGYT